MPHTDNDYDYRSLLESVMKIVSAIFWIRLYGVLHYLNLKSRMSKRFVVS